MTPDQLQATRETLDLSIEAMGDALGVSRRTIFRYLAGDRPIPPMAELLCAHLLRSRNQKLYAKNRR